MAWPVARVPWVTDDGNSSLHRSCRQATTCLFNRAVARYKNWKAIGFSPLQSQRIVLIASFSVVLPRFQATSFSTSYATGFLALQSFAYFASERTRSMRFVYGKPAAWISAIWSVCIAVLVDVHCQALIA